MILNGNRINSFPYLKEKPYNRKKVLQSNTQANY